MSFFQIEPIAQRIKALAGKQSVIIVAIDGGGGAGKSTLAAELADAADALVVHGDDFYRVMARLRRRGENP